MTVMAASMTIGLYTLNYLNVFATHTLGFPSAQAFGAVALAGACGVIFNPISGWLSDRIGRKPVMMTAFGASFDRGHSMLCDDGACADGPVTLWRRVADGARCWHLAHRR
jgi:MFS family permease